MQPDLFKLEEFFERFEHVQGMNVMGASDVEQWTVADLLKLSPDLALGSISLGYEEVTGRKSLRQAIADSYPESGLSAENILVTNGASEAILLAMHASLKPGTSA